MSKYRRDLPQLRGSLFLTDGGIETDLIFNEGLELPHFAAVELLRTPEGRRALDRYYRRHAAIALDREVGFVLESPTWRASLDWADPLGYTTASLRALNREAVALLVALRAELETPATPMVVSGCIGPRGDGYRAEARMSAGEAADYHTFQVGTFASTDADLVTAITMNYVEEAIGVALAADAYRMPSVISFTVETDGRLPTGQPLREAIERVDAETRSAPAYYMINCAHPSHFAHELDGGEAWTARVRGLRANASRASHAELDAAPTLDAGDPLELGEDYRRIVERHGRIVVLGGCCGTDHRHIAAIADACLEGAVR